MDMSVKQISRNRVQILTGQEWAAPAAAFHARVRAEMPESQRHWLLPKPPEYFSALLAGKNTAFLGILDDGQLAGFMGLLRVENFAAAHADGRITCPDDAGTLGKAFGQGGVAVCQSLCVSNAYLGRGFSRALVQAAGNWADAQGCAHLFAQIADQNLLSWLRFMQQDYALVTTWVAGHRRFLLRRLQPAEKAALLKKAKPADRHSFRKEPAQMPALLAQLTARLESGRIVALDQPDDRAALHFVFGKMG